MSNYLVDGASLTSVADAIRAKSSGSGSLAFPAGFISAISAIEGVPSYLSHMTLTPEENLRSVQIPIGSARIVLISSDLSWETDPPANTVVGGVISIANSGGIYATGSRLLTHTSAGGITQYASTSSGQDWSNADGVLTIAATSGWVLGSGVTYDFFWY